MRARIIVVSMSLVLVLLAATGLSAQTFRGTILGTVTDPSGAVIAGAKVTVKNVGTGLERTTETSADGSYSLPELPIGTYTVTVSQAGFQTFVATGVAVDVASERRVDAAMKTGEVSTKVEVSADQLPMVETTTNTLGVGRSSMARELMWTLFEGSDWFTMAASAWTSTCELTAATLKARFNVFVSPTLRSSVSMTAVLNPEALTSTW